MTTDQSKNDIVELLVGRLVGVSEASRRKRWRIGKEMVTCHLEDEMHGGRRLVFGLLKPSRPLVDRAIGVGVTWFVGSRRPFLLGYAGH